MIKYSIVYILCPVHHHRYDLLIPVKSAKYEDHKYKQYGVHEHTLQGISHHAGKGAANVDELNCQKSEAAKIRIFRLP